jgi:glycosyltransferase involved in cell wall biosynthesis
MNIKIIYIITDSPIPIGMAPASRIFSYAKGFLYHKLPCEIIVFRKTESGQQIRNSNTEGESEGVKFRYLFKSTIKSTFFFKRRLDNFIGIVKLFLFSVLYVKPKSVIIYYSSYTMPVVALRLAKVFNKVILLKEEGEHPTVRKRDLNLFNRLIFDHIHYRLFNGFLLITQNLMQYFDKKYPGKAKIHITLSVDLERFLNLNTERKKIITYLGELNDKKDGVDILIKAFAKVIQKYPGYYLNLYGEAENKELKDKYEKDILNYGIEENVVFRGSVDRNTIPNSLIESTVLVLPRPDSIQARNGFPTKLGEYLATGNPVVVTSVGEIPNYLIDKKSAFMAIPGSVENLAEKICEVLNNLEFAKKVGLNGQIVAEKHFNKNDQTKKIIEFIRESF